MTAQQIQLSLQTKKIHLSFWQKVSHFGIVGFLFFIPLIFGCIKLMDAINGTIQPLRTEELYILIIPTLLGMLFYKFQSNKLKLKEIQTAMTREKLVDIIEKVGADLKWYPEEINNNIVIAKTHPSFFSGSYGEQITILFDTNRILVNSICDPDKTSSVVSMGRNKKNVNKLVQEIVAACR